VTPSVVHSPPTSSARDGPTSARSASGAARQAPEPASAPPPYRTAPPVPRPKRRTRAGRAASAENAARPARWTRAGARAKKSSLALCLPIRRTLVWVELVCAVVQARIVAGAFAFIHVMAGLWPCRKNPPIAQGFAPVVAGAFMPGIRVGQRNCKGRGSRRDPVRIFQGPHSPHRGRNAGDRCVIMTENGRPAP